MPLNFFNFVPLRVRKNRLLLAHYASEVSKLEKKETLTDQEEKLLSTYEEYVEYYTDALNDSVDNANNNNS